MKFFYISPKSGGPETAVLGGVFGIKNPDGSLVIDPGLQRITMLATLQAQISNDKLMESMGLSAQSFNEVEVPDELAQDFRINLSAALGSKWNHYYDVVAGSRGGFAALALNDEKAMVQQAIDQITTGHTKTMRLVQAVAPNLTGYIDDEEGGGEPVQMDFDASEAAKQALRTVAEGANFAVTDVPQGYVGGGSITANHPTFTHALVSSAIAMYTPAGASDNHCDALIQPLLKVLNQVGATEYLIGDAARIERTITTEQPMNNADLWPMVTPTHQEPLAVAGRPAPSEDPQPDAPAA